MKLIAAAFLVAGLLCNSALAAAEDPIPFSALMQTAGAQPGALPTPDANNQSTAVSTPRAHTHMTTAGKIMTGTGIFMFVAGGVGLLGTAVFSRQHSGYICCLLSSSDQAKLYGVSGGLFAGGATLIILGAHRRSAH